MSNGNIFLLIECKHQRTVLVTHSAKIALKYLVPGVRVDIWRNNHRVRKVLASDKFELLEYVKQESEYLSQGGSTR
jgi:hypothetical protein